MGLCSSSPTSAPSRVEPSILRELHKTEHHLNIVSVITVVLWVLAVLFLAISETAEADELKTFTWTNPDAYEDETPLDPADLVSYDLGCTTVSGDPYQVLDTFPASLPLPTSHALSLPPGDYWCVLRVSTADATSVWSNEIFFTIPHPAPKPPADFAVD